MSMPEILDRPPVCVRRDTKRPAQVGLGRVRDQRAPRRVQALPHSASCLGPHPRQAQEQGCRLGRAREHDRHAALAAPARLQRPLGTSPGGFFFCWLGKSSVV
jgi:hypothetical protein